MPRVLLVDDSASVRALLGEKLRQQGYEVVDLADAVTAAERALAQPPSIVVTDLWMPGVSGVQLCRLLRAEPATSHVPVVLLTASDDRKSRFWARSAGAVAYCTKAHVDELLRCVKEHTSESHTAPPGAARVGLAGSVHERLSQLLDTALFESTIAGEIRALAQNDDVRALFGDLVRLSSEVVSYRWLALAPLTGELGLLLHAPPTSRGPAVAGLGRESPLEREARDAGQVRPDAPAFVVEDERALEGRMSPPLVAKVTFGATQVGTLALSPGPRGASRDDEAYLRQVASELGGPLRMVALVDDARRLAATDTLTGLMNRRAFVDAMERERSRADRHLLQVSLLLLDVDHFKRVNDTRGHAAGDTVLRGVAEVLARIARKSDYVARWGGEEFVVALTQTGDAGARVAAERLRRAIAEAVHRLPDGETLQVTASIGLVSAQPAWTIDDLVTRADEAMYAAKSRGRNRVEVA